MNVREKEPVVGSEITVLTQTCALMRRLRSFLQSDLLLPDRTLSPSGHRATRVLLQLNGNLWSLLHQFRRHVCRCLVEANDAAEETYETDDQTVVCSLAVAAYLTSCCKSSDLSFFLPVVHSHVFALGQLLPVVMVLFERSEPPVTKKGLHLMNHLLQNVGEGSLCGDFMDLLRCAPVHRSITKVMRFSADAECRVSAVETFKRLVRAFDARGRIKLMSYLIADPGQSAAVIELLLMQYRSFLMQDASKEYGRRSNLRTIVDNSIAACFRTNSSPGSDVPADALIQEKSECILALVNFVRFLLLNNSLKDETMTHMGPKIRNQLICPLKQELESTKGKLVQELTNASKQDSKSKADALQQLKSMQLRIANDDDSGSGGLADDCPPDFQEQGLRLSLIKVDMIQSVVQRIEELMA